jgi:hypothetical protein
MNGAIKIIMPGGAFGAWDGDTALDTMLRTIANAAETDPGAWSDKYGADIDNATFMMHRYCWCEREDCHWCGGCQCPESSFHYLVDGEEVTYDQWMDFYMRHVYGMTEAEMKRKKIDYWAQRPKHYERRSDEANKRRTTRHDAVCDYCLGRGIFAESGAEPGRGAPHFWHKPSGFKVWWYKYIGRDTETNMKPTPELLAEVFRSCREALPTGPDQRPGIGQDREQG